LTLTEGIPFVNVGNVLSEQKKQQVIALGGLRWTLRRIERETGVRRETAAACLKAAGVAMRPPGSWGRRPPAEPANGVTAGSGGQLLNQPAAEQEPGPQRSPSAGACEACAVIITAPGEDYGECRVMVRGVFHPGWFRTHHRDLSNLRFP
jgi:hypothetical protein